MVVKVHKDSVDDYLILSKCHTRGQNPLWPFTFEATLNLDM